jgi:hypothetical protein
MGLYYEPLLRPRDSWQANDSILLLPYASAGDFAGRDAGVALGGEFDGVKHLT